MNQLQRHLTELAFQLLQTDCDLDHEAAAWIQKCIKADKARRRKKRKRKVRLADHGKAGTFYLDHDRLEE